VSFSLSIPIFNRFQTRTNTQRSLIQLSNAELDMENLSQGIALEVRQAYLDYETAVKRLDVTEKQLLSAQKALEVEQERYDVGASTLVELTQAQASFVSASSQRVQAIYQFHFQHRLIDYYQGTLDPNESLF
jgi:outer membrane protein